MNRTGKKGRIPERERYVRARSELDLRYARINARADVYLLSVRACVCVQARWCS